MRFTYSLCFALVLASVLASAAPAFAADSDKCGEGLICASEPKTVVAALQEAGFKAKLSKQDDGNPQIESAAEGHDFEVYFMDCEKGEKCASLQFRLDFSAEDDNTPDYANRWNNNKRFIQMSVDDKKRLYLANDLTTVGGLNAKNFADVLDWWTTMLGGFNDFVDEQRKLDTKTKK